MSFATYDFLFYFMPPAMAVLIFASFYKPKTFFLPAILITSVVFYGIGSIPHLLLLLGLILISWIMAYFFKRFKSHDFAKLFLWVAILINLSALAVWKYGESIVGLWNSFGLTEVQQPGLLMPLGISFYVFQQVGYLLDLKRNRATVTSPLNYAAFIMFFPQLLAGPIVTHKRMTREFGRILNGFSLDDRLMMACQGISWFSLGLFKKVVIADSLGRITTPLMSKAAFGDLNIIEAWQLMLIAPTRVYFDFCGYSEMAVGLGLCIGLRIPANFNAPFRANSMRQFWTRWHITFHHFIRDHLYSPLKRLTQNWPFGGAISLFFAITLSSLWHGNTIQFFFWGMLVWLSMFVTTRLFSVFNEKVRTLLTVLMSLSFFGILGIVFTAPDLDIAKTIVKQLGAVSTLPNGLSSLSPIQWGHITFIVLMILFVRVEISAQVLIESGAQHRDRHIFGYRPPLWAANYGWLFSFCLLLVISFYFVGLSPPFVYFQF